MHLGKADVARVAQVATVIALREGTLHAGSMSIVSLELGRPLPRPRRLDCLMLLPRANTQRASTTFGTCTILLLRAAATIRRPEVNDNHVVAVGILGGTP